jgi:hypothetical protein
MYNFVVQTGLILSLTVIVYLLARALPRVAQEIESGPRHGAFDKFMKRIPLERLDIVIHGFAIKILRKTKIIVLKVDNLINSYLDQLKKHSLANETHTSTIREKMELISGNGEKENEQNNDRKNMRKQLKEKITIIDSVSIEEAIDKDEELS